MYKHFSNFTSNYGKTWLYNYLIFIIDQWKIFMNEKQLLHIIIRQTLSEICNYVLCLTKKSFWLHWPTWGWPIFSNQRPEKMPFIFMLFTEPVIVRVAFWCYWLVEIFGNLQTSCRLQIKWSSTFNYEN